jgi:hypothetical protein
VCPGPLAPIFFTESLRARLTYPIIAGRSHRQAGLAPAGRQIRAGRGESLDIYLRNGYTDSCKSPPGGLQWGVLRTSFLCTQKKSVGGLVSQPFIGGASQQVIYWGVQVPPGSAESDIHDRLGRYIPTRFTSRTAASGPSDGRLPARRCCRHGIVSGAACEYKDKWTSKY